ncbi:MAG: hypothetical protein K2K75_07555 [Muribaculaceae bacterium]|nr:hypothetical protein [Muribaculaceae bacterium]
MKVSLAPYMPIVRDCISYEREFRNLSLYSIPDYVSIYVVGKWDELLMGSAEIMTSYEIFRLLIGLPVIEISPVNKAKYIKVSPEVLADIPEENKETVCQQLYALMNVADSRRIFAGADNDCKCMQVTSDRETEIISNFNPFGDLTLLNLLDSYMPKLEQLKHFHTDRNIGAKQISAFSAYDRNDESYAKKLLMTAFLDHEGDVDERTYLYTYDKKNKTFVEFRPGRNNVYHGMNISLGEARKRAPLIVRKFHK